jgi:hypothetical protein
MRHPQTGKAEERSEVSSAELGPLSESFEAGVAGEFGNDGEREQGREGIAFAAGVTAVRNGGEVVSESLKAESKRNISGKRQDGQACGRVHRAPPE